MCGVNLEALGSITVTFIFLHFVDGPYTLGSQGCISFIHICRRFFRVKTRL